MLSWKMNYSFRNQLIGCHILFQTAVFLGGLHQCVSAVTYHPSSTESKGSELGKKCKDGGERLARIEDTKSLNAVKQVIDEKKEYWTGLSYHKNKGYCWKKDGDKCKESATKDSSLSSILQGDDESSWKQGWYCFSVRKDWDRLKAEKCSNKRKKYICEKDFVESLSSVLIPKQNSSASAQPENMVTKTNTEPTATVKSVIVTSSLPRINTLRISTEIALTPSFVVQATVTPTATPEVVASESSPKKPGLTSNVMKTEIFRTTKETVTPTATTAVVATLTLTAASSPKKPGLTSNVMKTEIFRTTKETVTPTATTAVVATLTLTAASSPKKPGLTSDVVTTEIFRTIKDALTTAIAAASSTQATSNKIPPPQEKLSASDKLRQYVSVISSLNASDETSFQMAKKATNNLFRSLKKHAVAEDDINILSATRQLETFAINYGKIHYKANESNVISEELFAMKIQKVSADNKNAIIFSVAETDLSKKEGRARISLPSGVFNGQEAVVVSTLYSDIRQWIPDVQDVELDGQSITDLELGSRLIASKVDPEPSGTLEENVTITFSYGKKANEGNIPHCVFWDFSLKSALNGSWSSAGCSLVRSVDNQVTCSCNHLTNFAVLMQVGDKKISSNHKVALEIITYVGCGLSLAGELLTIIAHCALMNLKQEQIQIHFNLAVAIAIAQLVFLCGIDASESKGACVFVAALIHYFYLAGFAWMLFEGIYLYLMVVKVFNTVVRMRLFYATAWGFPLLMVALSLLIASGLEGGVNSYVHGEFCWVSFSNNLIWTFAAPVLVVCLINSAILIRVVYEIIHIQSDKTSELDKIRQGSKALVVLFPLLGLTWLFGILSVTDAGLVFQYIFTILNSLQGLFIFIIHVLKNSDVRAAFRRKKQKWMDWRSISTSRVSSQGMTLSSSKLTGNEFHELNTRRDTPSSSVGYSNTTCKEQDRTFTPVQM